MRFVLIFQRKITKRAFTLIELLVSLGVYAILIVIVAIVFKMAIDASSQAIANNQVMGTLRTIEQQLRYDIQCIHRNSFLGISYEEVNDVRFDRMVFFMCGPPDAFNFALNVDDSDPNNVIITEVPIGSPRSIPMREHVGRIHWGHSEPIDDNILARRQKLMVPRLMPILAPPVGANEWYNFHDAETFGDQFARFHREDISAFFDPNDTCLMCDDKYYGWLRRPVIDKNVGQHMRLGDGCLEFKIQRWRDNRWFPENDELINEYWNGPRILSGTSYNGWHRRDRFPEIFKITITLIDKNERLLPQTFTMAIDVWSK